MNEQQTHFVNNEILRIARKIDYTVADLAPGTEQDLFACDRLVIWSGASDKTIYGAANVNHAFRAWHDTTHLRNRLGFTTAAEIEIGRIQAAQCSSDLLAELIYCEVAGQVMHYAQTGEFVQDQKAFTLAWLRARRVI